MKTKHDKKKQSTARMLWRLALLAIGVAAVAQELRKPASERAWHGKVADLVPYDFRKPTMERFKATYWDPEGPILPGKAWGVGWALNVGAIKQRLGF